MIPLLPSLRITYQTCLLAGFALVATLGSVQVQAQTCTTTIGSNGNATYNTTGPNQTICIISTTFSRTININHANCTLNIGPGVTFTGILNINMGGTSLTINNNGTMSATLGTFRGGAIINAGSASWNSNIDAVTAATTVTNSGTWSSASRFNNVAAPLTLTNNSTWGVTISTSSGASLSITNTGTWNVGFGMAPGTNTFVNTSTGNATFAFVNFAGSNNQIDNQGTMQFSAGAVYPQNTVLTNAVNATLTTNELSISTNASLLNAGTLQATSFYNNGGTTTNTGTLNASANFDVYSGTVNNRKSIVVARNFTNNGTVTGPEAPSRAGLTVGNVSTNNGIFGVTGQLDLCDAGNSNGFDVNNGTVGPATTFCSPYPLPVSLVSFTVKQREREVLVKWATATELRNDYFVVERSADGNLFTAVHRVKGQGTATWPANYSYVDSSPLAGVAYYRLRQVDTDGTYTYSAVAVVEDAQHHSVPGTVVLSPNPASRQVVVQGNTASAIQLEDLTGRVLRSQAGGNKQLNLEGIRPGLYVVRVGNQTSRLQVE